MNKGKKVTLTLKEFEDRVPDDTHSQSEVFVTGRDALGMIVRVPVRGVRVTFGPMGKPDLVEVLT
jgi:hypothetical protein